MHTYRASSNREGKHGFQVGTADGSTFTAIGPHVEDEGEAAALASYLNGGAYKPETASDLFKPAKEAREKQQKDLEAQAKRDAEAEKAKQEAAANPPKPEPDEPVPPPPPKEQPKPRAHAAKAKQHVKTAKPARKHK